MKCRVCDEPVIIGEKRIADDSVAHAACAVREEVAATKVKDVAYDRMMGTLEVLHLRLHQEQNGRDGWPLADLLPYIQDALAQARRAVKPKGG